MKKRTKTKEQSEKMAELFDEDDNSQPVQSTDNEASVTSFDDKCSVLQATMEHEEIEPKSEDKPDNDIINKVLQEASTEKQPPKEEKDLEETISDKRGRLENLVENEEKMNKAKKKEKSKVEPEAKKEAEKITEELENSSADNPLSLYGFDLEFYKEVQQKYPQFNVQNEDVVFNGFYRWKVKQLKNLLGRYPLLNTMQLSGELQSIKLDHNVGEAEVYPELIRQKIDDAQKYRVRVTTILVQAYEQFFTWERTLELLRGKLWKDHHTKGAEKRDGLALEHLVDMEEYISQVKGIIEASKRIDGILLASSDSLSRQLTCLDAKEKTGFSVKLQSHQEEQEQEPKDSSLNDLDELGDNTTVEPPKHLGEVQESNFGVVDSVDSVDSEDDDLGGIG